jgi:D-psicose/D-tagatose/L-ribulose 3-epimerase
MEIGVSAFAWTTEFREPHFKLLPLVRDHGLKAFEIPMFDPVALDAPAIRRAMEANDLACTVCAILPSGINPISPEQEVRRKSFAHLVRCVETAAELGATLLGGPLFAPIGYLPPRRRSEQEWNWAIETFQQLGDTLTAHQVTLSIEPVNRSETFFLRTAAEARLFCDAIDHPRIGVTVDTFHANIEEKNLPLAVSSLGPRLKHIHASENDRGVPGSGHVDFPGIVNSLRQMNYDGYLIIEGFGYAAGVCDSIGALWAEKNTTPEDVAFQGYNYLRELLNHQA